MALIWPEWKRVSTHQNSTRPTIATAVHTARLDGCHSSASAAPAAPGHGQGRRTRNASTNAGTSTAGSRTTGGRPTSGAATSTRAALTPIADRATRVDARLNGGNLLRREVR